MERVPLKQAPSVWAPTSDPCFSCTVSCCRAFRIYMTPTDLHRISRGLGVPASDFCLPVQCSGETRDHAHLAFSLGEEERFLLALHRRASGCVFLMKVGDHRRCGIHGVRPLVCRSYPLAWNRGRTCMAQQALCPQPWPTSSAVEAEWAALHQQREQESFQYQALLDTWHEEGLPALRATGLPTRAFRARFGFFLDFLANFPGSI